MASNETTESGLLQDKLEEALEKATRVLSNLHRVQSYLEIIKTVSPQSGAPSNDVVKNALEQMRIIRTDTAALLQTVYLTEIGLQSLQDFSKQGSTGNLSNLMPVVMSNPDMSSPVAINGNQGEDSVMVNLSEEGMSFSTSVNPPSSADEMAPPLKKMYVVSCYLYESVFCLGCEISFIMGQVVLLGM